MMKRSDLETLIVDKIIEEIATNSNIGVLNEKLRQVNAQKDRLYSIISNLQRHVTELFKEVRSAAENVGKNQKSNQHIRYCRSVGVQVLLDGSITVPQPQPISLFQPESSKPINMELKKTVLTSDNLDTTSSPLAPQSGQAAHPGLKRSLLKPSASAAKVGRKTDIQNKVPNVRSQASPVLSTPSKINSVNTANAGPSNSTKIPARSPPAIQQQQHNNTVMRNPAAVMATKFLNLNGSGWIMPKAVKNISYPLRGTLALVPGCQEVMGGPIGINTGAQIMKIPLIASAAVQQQTRNDVILRMVKKQLSQQQEQLINTSSMVPTQQEHQQGATQVNANKVMNNDPGGLQTSCPMDQVSRANTRAVVKKCVLPPLPPPAIVGAPRRCSSKDIPPRPDLNVAEGDKGIVLSWTLKQLGPNHAEIQNYQLYACQVPLFTYAKSRCWKRVGDVKALRLPMACTLSQLCDANRYHFIVRGVDVYNRTGPFCESASITLNKK